MTEKPMDYEVTARDMVLYVDGRLVSWTEDGRMVLAEKEKKEKK